MVKALEPRMQCDLEATNLIFGQPLVVFQCGVRREGAREAAHVDLSGVARLVSVGLA